MDSAALEYAVVAQDAVTQLLGAIRRVGRTVSGAEALISKRCYGHAFSPPGEPPVAQNIAPVRVISTVDPGASHVRKSRAAKSSAVRPI
ncbi:hypothetical protein [Pseudofrankia sp. BMG5.37]|uniref:hypothetical protein n=1 Tax=Pseudofrankia sp. BMG5.37 TaxID=3050035 RepID=UPI0037C99709